MEGQQVLSRETCQNDVKLSFYIKKKLLKCKQENTLKKEK